MCVCSQPCLSALLAGRLSPFCGRLGGFSGPVLPWVWGTPGKGVYGPAWVCPGPSPLFVSSPRDTGSLVMWEESCPLVCRNSRALSSQLRSTPAAGWTILAVSRGPVACGSALAPAQALRGASGWELGGGARGALFSRVSAFSAALPVGANSGQGGGPELSERGADAGSGAFLPSHRATRGHEQRCESWGLAPLATFSEPGALSGLFRGVGGEGWEPADGSGPAPSRGFQWCP